MENFRLEVQLKQITPHIHFQYGDAGAVLRATEVKPKLDQFLAQQLQATGNPVPRQWLLPSQEGQSREYHFAYKLSITGRMETVSWSELPMFFGNVGKNKNRFDGVMAKLPITMVFLCGIQDRQQRAQFMSFLKDHIQDFFLTHNFGSRQTKGYGGYLVEKIGGIPVKQDPMAAIGRHYPMFVYFTTPNQSLLKRFKQIKQEYNHLRTGRYGRATNTVEVVFRCWSSKEQSEIQFHSCRSMLGFVPKSNFSKGTGKEGGGNRNNRRKSSPVLIKVLPEAVCLLPMTDSSRRNANGFDGKTKPEGRRNGWS